MQLRSPLLFGSVLILGCSQEPVLDATIERPPQPAPQQPPEVVLTVPDIDLSTPFDALPAAWPTPSTPLKAQQRIRVAGTLQGRFPDPPADTLNVILIARFEQPLPGGKTLSAGGHVAPVTIQGEATPFALDLDGPSQPGRYRLFVELFGTPRRNAKEPETVSLMATDVNVLPGQK